MRLTKHRFNYQGIQMFYYLAGEGKPLLFLPGAIKAEIYTKNVQALAQNYQVIIPDLPGFGSSSIPPTVWGFTEYAACVNEFVTSLHLKEFYIVGHSFGAGVGLFVAASNLAVKKMVLYGAMAVATRKTKVQFYFDMLVKKTYTDVFYHNDIDVKAIMLNNGISTIVENFFAFSHMMRIAHKALATSFNHPNVTIPILLLWGDHDELFPPTDAYELQKQLATATIEIIPGSHDWCILEPEKFCNRVIDFLSS